MPIAFWGVKIPRQGRPEVQESPFWEHIVVVSENENRSDAAISILAAFLDKKGGLIDGL
jgi:hypothetical protein